MTLDLAKPRVDFATRRSAAEIVRLVGKFPGLGIDVFVHEHDYNQVFNSRSALETELSQLRAECERLRRDAERPSKREKLASAILQGFCANPAVFASNQVCGWSLVNCTDKDLIGYCYHLADAAIDAASAEGER